jgi:hypothetical protein
MIASPNHPAWKKVVTGEVEVKSTKLAVNMMLKNCRLNSASDPSPANIGEQSKHAYDFFKKYETVFEAELKQIFG